MEAAELQRVRLTYRKGGALRYIAHLDLMRTWERALRRARLPLAYTQGFSPHPRIALAAPLPVGTVGERELMDLWLEEPLSLEHVRELLSAVLPADLEVLDAEEVVQRWPSLQSSTRSATYRASFDAASVDEAALRSRVARLLALDELPWEERRGEKLRNYDLRAVVRDLGVSTEEGVVVLTMDLELTQERTGRPSAIFAALELEADPLELVRTEIVIDRPQVALQAWRRRGRHES